MAWTYFQDEIWKQNKAACNYRTGGPHYAKKKTGSQVLENKISTQIRGRWLFLKLALKVKTFWNNNILHHICGLRETRIWVYRFLFIASSVSWDRFFKIGQSRQITRRKMKQNATRLPWKDVSLHGSLHGHTAVWQFRNESPQFQSLSLRNTYI